MIEIKQQNSLPAECIECESNKDSYIDCSVCEFGAARYKFSRKQELEIQKKAIQKNIDRLKRKIIAIDKEIDKISE